MIHRHCMVRNGDGVIDLFLCLGVSENTFVTKTLNYFFFYKPKDNEFCALFICVIYGKISAI